MRVNAGDTSKNFLTLLLRECLPNRGRPVSRRTGPWPHSLLARLVNFPDSGVRDRVRKELNGT